MSGASTRAAHPSLQPEAFAPMDARAAASYDDAIDRFLAEDVGAGDATSDAVVDAGLIWQGRLVSRADGVVAGLPVVARVFARVNPEIRCELAVRDGDRVKRGETLATVSGPARGLLTAERVALNILGRLSGIATLTRAYVDAVGQAHARITDTRKTTPGLRALERYAVRAGGGTNHRFDLSGAVLIKDNHIAAVGSVATAVQRARLRGGNGTLHVEVECDTIVQVREALAAGADSILLDNMDLETMREAVALCRGKATTEASGGMSLARISDVASAGVDLISIGALTHSAPALDIALDFDARRHGEGEHG